ncbi:MAG TPA: SdiA-regulated domain-containing protein, partial [Rubricoccaceae bacterium]
AGAVWVLGADGTLYEIPDDGSAPREHDTPLKKKCDAEGLALDGAQNRLLIACKEDPGEGLNKDEVKAVYAFSLATRTLDATPVLLLPRNALDAAETFKPSALAIHPQTGETYVLSSVRNAIAVVDAGGAITSVAELPEALNTQPEGLAFTADGTLYIANEGGNGQGTISRYAPAR